VTSARTSRNGSLGQIFEVARGAGAEVVAQVLEQMTTKESGSPGHRDSVALHLAPLGGVSGSLVIVLRVTHVRRDPLSWASQGGCSASTVLSVPVAPAATAESAGASLWDVSLTISVIGTGYLGVVHAASKADLGHTVIAIDNDAAKVESLSRGVAPMFEPGLDELLGKVLPKGDIRFTTDYAQAAGADVHFICVGTPQRKGENAADTSYVFAAAQSLAPHLSEEALVVGKSTVPVGTAAQLRDRLQQGAPKGVRARLAWNPEFLREGFAIQDTLSPDRIVYGLQTDGEAMPTPAGGGRPAPRCRTGPPSAARRRRSGSCPRGCSPRSSRRWPRRPGRAARWPR